MVEQREDLLLGHGVRIFFFDAFDFGGDAFVHIGRGLLVDVTEGVFQRIFAHPYRRGEVIAVEVLFGGGYGIVVVHLVG